MIRTPSIALAAGLLVAGCMTSQPVSGSRQVVTVQMGLPYGPLAAERGDLYLPKGSSNPPVVLVIHGGGWVAGDRSTSTGLARQLAERGLAAFNIDYRLAVARSPDTQWPAQLVDAQLAVRWLRGHGAALGIDTANMGAMGDSAGGHMAVLLGVLPGIVPGDQAGLYPDQRPDVGAIADLFGPTDIATLPPWVRGIYPALFGTQSPPSDQVAAMSPLPLITARAAPMLIIQGKTDVIVPPAQSERLADALRTYGVRADVITYAGGHGFEGLDGAAIYAVQQRAITWLAAQVNR